MKSRLETWVHEFYAATQVGPYNKLILVFILVITIFLGLQLPKVKFNYDIEGFFSKEDPEVNIYQEFKSEFGNENNTLLIGIEGKNGIFNRTFLHKIDTLSQLLKTLHEIESVTSPTTTREYIKMPLGGFYSRPIIHLEREDYYLTDSLKLCRTEQYSGLFSMSNSSVAILLKIHEGLNSSENEALIKKINNLLTLPYLDLYEYHLAGRIHTQHYYITTMKDEMVIFSMLAIFLFGATIWSIFRQLIYVLIPLIVLFVVLVWVYGLMGLFQLNVDLMLTILPTLIFVLGTSVAIHFLSKFHLLYAGGGIKQKALKQAFLQTTVPNSLISVTTAIGLASLYFIPVESIQNFGILSSVAILLSISLNLILLPSLVRLFPIKTNREIKRRKAVKRMGLFFVSNILSLSKKQVLITYFIVSFIALFGMSKIHINNHFLDDLTETSLLKKDLLFFEDNFAGIRPFELLVKPNEEGRDLLSYESMKALDSIESVATDQYNLGLVQSPVRLLKALNQSMHGGNQLYYRLPKDSRQYDKLIRQARRYHLFEKTRSLLGSDAKMARISGRIIDQGRLYYQEKDNSLKEAVAGFPFLNIQLTGVAYLIDNSNASVTRSFVKGLAVVFVVVMVLILLYTYSLRITLLSLIVNVIPLTVCGAIMGFMEIDLKISTALIFTIVLGISVDDTIHFLHHYLSLRERYHPKVALKLGLIDMIHPIMFTTMVLFFGFMIFSLSSFESIQVLGWMTGLALIVAMLSDVLLLPIFLSWYPDFDENKMG